MTDPMTYDEHLAEAERHLRNAENMPGAGPEYITAEATVGLLHLGLAAAKPIVTLAPSPDLAEVVREELGRLTRENR